MTDAGSMRARYRRIMRFAARLPACRRGGSSCSCRASASRGLAARGRAARLQRIAQRFHVLAVDLGGLMIKVGQFMSSRLDVLPPEITKELEGLQDEVPPVPFDRDPGARRGRARRAARARVRVRRPGAGGRGIPRPGPPRDAVGCRCRRHRPRAMSWSRSSGRASTRSSRSTCARCAGSPAGSAASGSCPTASTRPRSSRSSRARASRRSTTCTRPRTPSASRRTSPATHRVSVPDDRVGAHHPARAHARGRHRDQDQRRRRLCGAAGIDPPRSPIDFASVDVRPALHGRVLPRRSAPRATSSSRRVRRGAEADRLALHLHRLRHDGRGARTACARGLRGVLIAAASRDGKGMVDGIRDVGVLLPSADTAELERAMTKLFARFGGMGFAELQEVDPREFREFAIEFGDVVRSLPFQLPENFLLIIRAMSLTSGMCSSLDPAFNIWDAVEPYAGQLIREEGGNVVQAFAQAGRVGRRHGRATAAAARRPHDPHRGGPGGGAESAARAAHRQPRAHRAPRHLGGAVRRAVHRRHHAACRRRRVRHGADGVSVLPLLHALFAGWISRRLPVVSPTAVDVDTRRRRRPTSARTPESDGCDEGGGDDRAQSELRSQQRRLEHFDRRSRSRRRTSGRAPGCSAR